MIDVKCTFQWILVFSHTVYFGVQPTPKSNFRIVSLPKKETPYKQLLSLLPTALGNQ